MTPSAAGGILFGWLLLASASPALEEGNRLFRQGQLAAALESYAAGYSPTHPDPVLTYNLGTTAHRLGRLPEAVLWYRRARRVDPTDVWLQENLELARQSLGTSPQAPPGLAGWLATHRVALQIGGVVLAWAALGLLLRHSGSTRRWTLVLALSALLLFGFGFFDLPGLPQAAVLLQSCAPDLPAGSEIWVTPVPEGWRIAGTENRICATESLELVDAPPPPTQR